MEINRNKGKQKNEDGENEDDEDEDAGDGEGVASSAPVSAAGEADASADETSSNGAWSDEELVYQAKRCGLPTTESELRTARRLGNEYGYQELKNAMLLAWGRKKSVWTFVEGILKNKWAGATIQTSR